MDDFGKMFGQMFGSLGAAVQAAATQGQTEAGGDQSAQEQAAASLGNLFGNAGGSDQANPFGELFSAALRESQNEGQGEGTSNPAAANMFGDLLAAPLQGLLQGQNQEEMMKELAKQQQKLQMKNMSQADVVSQMGKIMRGSTEKKKTRQDIQENDVLSRNCKELSDFMLQGCYPVDWSIFPKMTILKVSFPGDALITDVVIAAWVLQLDVSGLMEVDLSGCVNVTDFGMLWLGKLAAKAPQLEKVSLDGCVKVTDKGLAYLTMSRQPLELSLRGTSVALIPDSMVQGGYSFHLEGCPLLQVRDPGDQSEEQAVRMSNVTICRPSDITSSLTEYLTRKVVSKADIVNYKKQWKLSDIDFSITETSLDFPPSEVVMPEQPTQVIVPFDLDGDVAQACRHVCSAVTHFVNKCQPVYCGIRDVIPGLSPIALLSSSLDNRNGFLKVFPKGLPFSDDSDDDEDDEPAAALFAPSVGRLNRIFEVEVVSCILGFVNVKIALHEYAHNSGSEHESPLKLLKPGDLMSFGLDSTDITCPFSLDNKEYTLVTCVNGKKVHEQQATMCGQFYFVLSTSLGCILKIKNIKKKKCQVLDGHLKNIMMQEMKMDNYSFDAATGILSNTSSEMQIATSIYPASRQRKELEVEILKLAEQDNSVCLGLICQFDQTELPGLEDQGDIGYHAAKGKILFKGDEVEATMATVEDAKCRPGDRIKIVITDLMDDVIVQGHENIVSFYKNDKLVHEVKYRSENSEAEAMATCAVFAVSLNQEESVRILNYCPTEEYQCQVRLARFLTNENFFIPLKILGNPDVTEAEGFGAKHGDWGVVSWISLSKAHPVVKITVAAAKPSNNLLCGATRKHFEDVEDDTKFFKKSDVKEGEVYNLSLSLEGVVFDEEGLPALGQTVNLVVTHGDVTVGEMSFTYVGGGLHPTIKGENITVTLHNMDLESVYELMAEDCNNSTNPAFVILGVSNGDKDSESKMATVKDHLKELKMPESVDSLITELSAQNSFENQIVMGHHLKLVTRWECFKSAANTKFLTLNQKTGEGLKELQGALVENYESMAVHTPHIYRHLPRVKEVLQTLASTDRSENLLITRDTCHHIKGFTVKQVEAILTLMHDWGKVVFFPYMDPWVCILDVEKFVKVLVQLKKQTPSDTTERRVRCLSADTPLWKDTELLFIGKKKDLDNPHLLLQLLLESHQLLRLPAFRGQSGDIRSYLLHPLNLKEPSVPLSNFFKRGQKEDNLTSITVVCEFPVPAPGFIKLAILGECAQIGQPLVLAPDFLVTYQGAAQVVLAWQQQDKGEKTTETLVVNVKMLLPSQEERECVGRVWEYGWSIAHLYLDLVIAQCLKLHVPFKVNSDMKFEPANQSICSDHKWLNSRAENVTVSVCTLCCNCSQHGMACKFNRVYEDSISQCQCQPLVLCCQHCGICPACAKSLWRVRTALRPNISPPIEEMALSRGNRMFSVRHTMAPAIVNEVTVIRVAQGNGVPHFTVGLLSEDGSELLQVYPGPAMRGRAHQGYNYEYRKQATSSGDQVENAQTITLQLREPKEPYKEDGSALRQDKKLVGYILMKDCRLSHTTHCVRHDSTADVGLIVSEFQTSAECHYFEADITNLGVRSLAGVGMTSDLTPNQCYAHNGGNRMMTGCVWDQEKWMVGDQIGCGTRLEPTNKKQTVFFTHNGNLVCEHNLNGPERHLYAAILLQKLEAFRILPSALWEYGHEASSLTNGDEEMDEEFSDCFTDDHVKISPSRNISFPKEAPQDEALSATIVFKNITDSHLLLKVKTNKPQNYISMPAKSYVSPQQSIKIRLDLRTQGKSAEDYEIEGDKFLIQWAEMKHPKGHLSLDTLWNTKTKENAIVSHRLGCMWMDGTQKDQDVHGSKEHGIAQLLETTAMPPVDPSYQLDVLVNGNPIASYWVPRKPYRFMIEREEEEQSAAMRLEAVKEGQPLPGPAPLSRHLVVSMPQLPQDHQHKMLSVGMEVMARVNPELFLGKPDCPAGLKSNLEEIKTVYAVCTVKNVDSLDPTQLLLRLEATSRDNPDDTFTVNFTADTDDLQPLPEDITRDLDGYLKWDIKDSYGTTVIRITGRLKEDSYPAPLYLFPKEKGKGAFTSKPSTPSRNRCSDQCNLVTVQAAELYKAGPVLQTWQVYEETECDTSAILTFLPGDMSPSTLLHPSIAKLYDINTLKVHQLCKNFETKRLASGVEVQSPAHFVDAAGISPQHPLELKHLYDHLAGVYVYAALATIKVKLPAFRRLLQTDGQLTRVQAESLLQSIIMTYAATCQLYADIKYGALVNVPHNPDWEPQSFMPPLVDKDSTKFTDPGQIYNGTCKTHYNADLLEKTSDAQMDLTRFEPYAEVLTFLVYNLCRTNKTLPEELWSTLPSLRGLVLDGCSELHLFPERISSMRYLQHLSTKAQSMLEQLPADIGHCPNLMELQLGSSLISVLPCSITSCSSLRDLDLSDSMLRDLPSDIGKLYNLTCLDISHTAIMQLPTSFGNLHSLKVLRLAGVPWMMPRSGVKMRFDRSQYEKWHKDNDQNTKVLSEKVVHQLFAECDGDKNILLDEKEMGNLNARLYFMVPRFGHDYQEGDMNGGFPAEILRLTQLEVLDLSYQALRFIPAQISQLKKLNSLNLSHCVELERIPGSLGLLPKLSTLHLRGCPSLRTPPTPIVSRGTEAVLAYLKRLAGGFTENWRTKLMLVGLGAAGKTTLLRALMSQNNSSAGTTDKDVTNGIDIKTWTVKHASGQQVTFSAWDFAGQSVFYNTHQFFLSNRAVYLLLWASRSGYEHAGINFWLSSIKCHAPNAPIFVVATHYDQVKAELPQAELKRHYPQICGFHFVSSIQGTGIQDLKSAILERALHESYMGEHVPKVYLTLEANILRARKDTPFLPWSKVKQNGMEVGIYDELDVKRAVQFLHDQGTLQYFDNEFLRDYIVINPQWIVDVMSCIVTIKDSPIVDGRFYKKDIPRVWSNYPEELHEWLLRLTESFDLTFPHPTEQVNLVPCLLPEHEPDNWMLSELDSSPENREMMIIYRFAYLPAGLFNRLQVRLFQFSDGKAIWKRGSCIKKNGHLAHITQEGNQVLQVKVEGLRPENILFLIHEALESLIDESFHGVNYEYLIPCPDCISKVGTNGPALFKASLIREAVTHSAPFIQCRKYFHTVSMPTVQALMPPNDSSELDIHFERSIRSLTEIRNNFSTDIFINFTTKNIPKSNEQDEGVNPNEVIKALVSHGYKCWYDDNMTSTDIQSLTVALQESKMMLVFISTEFTMDAQCRQLFLHAAETLHKPYAIVQIGKDYDWQHTPIGAVIGPQKVFINMRKRVGFDKKLEDLKKELDRKLKGIEKPQTKVPRCFISYCWSNSKRAVKQGTRDIPGARGAVDPRDIKDYLEEHEISCWIDIEQTGKRGLFEDITEGIRAADVMVACVSDEYARSLNCMMELRFAACTQKMPLIFVIVGTGSEWEYKEVRILGYRVKATVVNLQKTWDDLEVRRLLEFVQQNLISDKERQERQKKEEAKRPKDKEGSISCTEVTKISFQEEFELFQRKIMRQATILAASMDTVPYPRLFILDFNKRQSEAVPAPKRPGSGTSRLARRPTDSNRLVEMNEMFQTEQPKEALTGGHSWWEEALCVRILCEHEQGWHYMDDVVTLDGMTSSEKEEFVISMAPFLGRLYGLFQHSGMALNCLAGEQGRSYKNFVVSHAIESSEDFGPTYMRFRELLIKRDVHRTYGSLTRCLLPTGRVSWLCREHRQGYRVTVLSSDVSHNTVQHSLITDSDRYLKDCLPHADHLRHGAFSGRRPQSTPPMPHFLDEFLQMSSPPLSSSSAPSALSPPGIGVAEDLFNTIKDGVKTNIDKVEKVVGTVLDALVPDDDHRSQKRHRTPVKKKRKTLSEAETEEARKLRKETAQRAVEKVKIVGNVTSVSRAFQGKGRFTSPDQPPQSQACAVL